MNNLSFEEAVDRIARGGKPYARDAYFFLREALDYSIKLFEKPVSGPSRHVSGRELLEGIRRFALQEYGPMAYRVLQHWGVARTDDFGEMVFRLVELGVLGKSEHDRREDFAGVYDFDAAFRRPFKAPAKRRGQRRATPRNSRRQKETER